MHTWITNARVKALLLLILAGGLILVLAMAFALSHSWGYGGRSDSARNALMPLTPALPQAAANDPSIPGQHLATNQKRSPHGTSLDIGLRREDTHERVTGAFRPGSHVHVYIPSIPYIAVSHATNGALVRPANNTLGWEYDLAISHRKISDRIWEFELRRNVRFQDGSVFDADAVLLNMKHFKRQPYTFTGFYRVFARAEKLSPHRVRFHLSEPYGSLMFDASWIQFYTAEYLRRFGWNGKPTCPNLAAPGPFGAGPFIMEEGYLEGDRYTDRIELVRNPYYYDPRYPKVERITIHTAIGSERARRAVQAREGIIDIAPIAFEYEVETLLSPYAKLVVTPSTNNYAVHFNLVNGHPALLDRRVRQALNRSIDQEKLLNLSMNGEGQLSPTQASPNYPGMAQAIADLPPYSMIQSPLDPEVRNELIEVIKKYQRDNGLDDSEPLKLTFLTQESFMFLIRDIKYFFSQIHVDLQVKLVNVERKVFEQLFSTGKDGSNTMDWDLLIWGNEGWYFNHPWNAFLTYRPSDVWSTIYTDKRLETLIARLFGLDTVDDGYQETVTDIVHYVYDNAFMLFLPSPYKVLAVNKEVLFRPFMSAALPLWDIEVSDRHWSVRDGAYPEALKQPVEVIRVNFPQ